jgi:outer membrane protein TolC
MGSKQAQRSPWRWFVCLIWLSLASRPCWASPVLTPQEDRPPGELSLEAAVAWALQHNPDLAAVRQQHDVAEAGVAIAQIYPYNPTFYLRTTYSPGVPPDVTNHAPGQGGLFFPVELLCQGKYRREAASAALTRTEWEIAFQEMGLAVRVIRAFQTVLYRQDKLKAAEDAVKLNQQVLEQARKLVDLGKLRGADLIVMRTDVEAARAAVAPARTAVAIAMAELYRSLGITGCLLGLQGNLEGPVVVSDCKMLLPKALELRADLRARTLAVCEAEARRRLQVADRFGNPTIGPFYEIDQTNVKFYGVQMNIPVPLFNTHRGDIQQREAEIQRAVLDVRRNEVQIQQDVEAALARLASARESAQIYQSEVLPNLRTALESLQKLFQQGEPGADLLRILDLERKLLQARSGYLDVLWEVSQAEADLAAAVGDPTLAIAHRHISQK